jgi:PAS domain S-box-containing protein
MNRAPHHRFFLWLAAALTVVVFAFDLLVALDVAAAVPYVLVIWLAFAAGNSRGVWIAAIGCSLLTLVGLFLSPAGGELWIVVVNGGLALLVIWVTSDLPQRIPQMLAEQTRRAEAAELSAADTARQREDERRRARAMASIMEDLRAQRQKLAASEQRFRATIEWAPTAMIMVDCTGQIVLVNAETEKMFGYSRDELLGQPVEQLVPERFRPEHPNYRSDFFLNPAARRMGAGRDLFGLRKDGSEFPVEIGLNPVTHHEGLFVLSAIVDITERKRLEERMQQANQALEQSNTDLEQFASIASHDLQEPLRKISTYAQLLQEECDQHFNEAGKEYLRVVIDGADRLTALVRDLLSLSRITTRGKTLTPMDANDCLRAAIENIELAIQESGAQVTSDRLPVVMADEGQLILLFQNLVGNAIKYRGKSAPEIHVGGRNSGKRFECFVRDNGIGIDSQYFERIFEIFQRLHNRREHGGTGIGLAICKRIVERFGGKIWVDSTPGAGSTFYFTIDKASKTGGQGVSSKEIVAVGATH